MLKPTMRELKVEDALLYLDQVKVEFGDQPHIYNEFLDIMKTFKTQQIDTPGVIRRVSNLFRGNRRLVLGFNTFLPEGYKIELPEGDHGPAVAVYRAPGSSVAHVLREGQGVPGPGSGPGGRGPMPPQAPPIHAGQPPPVRPGMPAGAQHPPGQPRDNAYGGQPMSSLQHSAQGHPPPAGARAPPPPAQSMKPPPQHDGGGPRAQHHLDQQQPPGRGPPNSASIRQPPPQDRPDVAEPPAPRMGGPPPQTQPLNHASSAGPVRSGPPTNGYNEQPLGPPQHQQQPAQQQLQQPGQAQQKPAQQNEQPGVMEFDHAINYVTTIKKRFANEPYTYKKFLEILHTYQKEQRGIKEVLDEVSTLFADHPDLLKEFTYFLPDAVQAQAKAQLDQVAKESEARKRAQSKQAPMQQRPGAGRGAPPPARQPLPEYDQSSTPLHFGASQGRSPEYENNIIRGAHFGVVSFAPVRPPRKNDLTPAQAAAKKGRPTAIPQLPIVPSTSETAFFQRAKEHLNRKELQADKPTGPKRHTPYTEFLKCLHLYGAGVLNKDELILLLKGLFMQGHAPKSGANAGGGNFNPAVAQDASDLLREFEEVLVGRGPYAEQEAAFKDKSKYGSVRSRDFDFSNCDNPTPSYRSYPSDYPHSLFLSFPGQTDEDAAVLNNTLICVGEDPDKRMTRSLEEYDSVRMRRNAYEEAMFRIEDERYEVDMAIERNAQAMRQIEPFAEEVQTLREQEEKDGQPIGRLQYQLNRYALNTIHINAIGRLYGDKGDEVLQHLVQNPLIVLPIIYQRLKQKDAEWRAAKADLVEKWNTANAANYEGWLDVRCYWNRRTLEQRFSKARLLEDCKRARIFSARPEKIRHDPLTEMFATKYVAGCPDPVAVLFEPCAVVQCKVDGSHKDALHLVIQKMKSSGVSAFDRERVGRILAEFVAPWFGYPLYWIMDEVRSSFQGKITPGVVKYARGQRVATVFGEGSVLAFMDKGASSGPKYRVKLPFGVAHLSPSAIMHALPSKDLPYVRRDGSMVRDDILVENGSNVAKLHEKYEMLFATENIYIFVRLYLLLCSLLSDIRNQCETFEAPEDPASKYYRPMGKGSGPETTHQKLDYLAILSSLQEVVSNQRKVKDLEALGRKVTKEKVHEIAAMPKLIDRCVDSLVSTAKEDCLLHLYDYCQYRQVDPVAVRTHCFSVSPEAVYRIQYDTTTGSMFFNYLPRTASLLTSPPIGADASNIGHEMSVDEDDPIEDSEEDNGRPSKRKKH